MRARLLFAVLTAALGAGLVSCEQHLVAVGPSPNSPSLYGGVLNDGKLELARLDSLTGEVEIQTGMIGVIPTGSTFIGASEHRILAELNDPKGEARLATFDMIAGTSTNDVGIPISTLLGVEGATGNLVAIAKEPETGELAIIVIHPNTGWVGGIGNVPGDAQLAGPLQEPVAFDGSKRIFGFMTASPESPSDFFVAETNGVPSLIVPTGQRGLVNPAWDPHGELVYAIAVGQPAALVSIDPKNGGTTRIGELPIDYVRPFSSAFDPGSNYYFFIGGAGKNPETHDNDRIFTVDVATGDVLSAPLIDAPNGLSQLELVP